MGNLDYLKEFIINNIEEYKSIPFWSWNNDLDEEKLVKQIEDMHSVNIGGFIIHARTGLKTEYLSEKWFSCVNSCLEKAKELNMNAWIYDENGWPSGFVGGKLLENIDNRARFLEYKVNNFYDENAYCVYYKDNNEYILVNSEKENINEYYSIYLSISPANTDILSPKVVSEFINLTHEEYYKRFKEYFGNTLVGFFTDEPQYYRYNTPYTNEILQFFDEDIKKYLIYLFVHDEKGYEFRVKYYESLNKLYVENYYKRLFDWCNEHNCKLTGHSIEENGLAAQMLGGAAVMPTYEYEHIPAIDWLGRKCGNELAPKQVGSVAAQLGIKHILTETFACSGYDVTPKELKSIGEFQYFNGVNMLCHHLYPYSIAGQGKYDHPPVFSDHSNWFKEFKEFNDYFNKLGTLIGNTTEEYDVGIIHPMKNVYLEYIRSEDYNSVKKLEEDFQKLLEFLRYNGITYQLIDETILKRYGKVEDDKLIVGNCVYDKIIVPNMKSISESTYNLLEKYPGKLLIFNEIEYLNGKKVSKSLFSTIKMAEILDSKKIKYFCEDKYSFITSRKGKIGEFLFIKNISMSEFSKIHIGNAGKEYKKLDLIDFKVETINDEIMIEPSGSIILIKDSDISETLHEDYEINITNNFNISKITDNYLILDYGFISFDGIKYSEKKSVHRIFDELLKIDYKGLLYIKHLFSLEEVIDLKYIIEKDTFDEIFVNGNLISVEKNNFDFNFFESNITKYLKKGENEIIYTLNYHQHNGVSFALFDPLATESLRNCLYYDKSIEISYLKGKFILDEDLNIMKQRRLPNIFNNLIENGYPFFKGELEIDGNVFIQEISKKVLLELDGRFLVANIIINDKQIDMVMDNKVEITDFIKKGDNKIKIILKSSLRNLFGPHHFKPNPEPLGVSPYNFTYRTNWLNNDPIHYTSKYNSVYFGVKKIVLKSLK